MISSIVAALGSLFSWHLLVGLLIAGAVVAARGRRAGRVAASGGAPAPGLRGALRLGRGAAPLSGRGGGM